MTLAAPKADDRLATCLPARGIHNSADRCRRRGIDNQLRDILRGGESRRAQAIEHLVGAAVERISLSGAEICDASTAIPDRPVLTTPHGVTGTQRDESASRVGMGAASCFHNPAGSSFNTRSTSGAVTSHVRARNSSASCPARQATSPTKKRASPTRLTITCLTAFAFSASEI